MKKFTVLLASVLVLTTILTGCGKKDARLGEIQKAGKIVLGTNATYPPYEFHKKIDGKDTVIGFDIAIGQAVADELGVKLEIKDMDFNGLLPALTAGKIDMIIAGMTPTDERKKSVDFSKIYYTAAQGVIVRKEDKDKFTTLESLDNQKIGVQTGSIQEDIAKEQVKNADLKSLGSVADLILQLQTKKVDALIVELPVAEAYIAKAPDLILADAKPKDDVGGSAIAVKKNNPSLVKEIDKVIDKLIAEKKLDQYVQDASNQMAQE
ncbi:transporter substrate-binding domain-containing protein [Gorillibacterium sp. sgz500922]|uniref:transporter substrate-binding domain-containing protein n=1 Tax=Gorillibacterium sp. sgz500922 TaxID=3446694 RepID=UPI003F670234